VHTGRLLGFTVVVLAVSFVFERTRWRGVLVVCSSAVRRVVGACVLIIVGRGRRRLWSPYRWCGRWDWGACARAQRDCAAAGMTGVSGERGYLFTKQLQLSLTLLRGERR